MSVWTKIKLRFAKGKPQSIPVTVIQRDPLRIRISEWRTSPELVKMAAETLRQPNVRQMLDCLRNEHLGFISTPLDASTDVVAALQRQAEGYQQALNNFEALGSIEKPSVTVEPTFEPEQK